MSAALAVRATGDRGRLLAWMYGPAEELAPAIAADVDLSETGFMEEFRNRGQAAVFVGFHAGLREFGLAGAVAGAARGGERVAQIADLEDGKL